MVFYVFQCKNCGRWGVREIRNKFTVMFKCKFCNKSFKVKKTTEPGLALNSKGPYGLPKEATLACQILNKPKRERL